MCVSVLLVWIWVPDSLHPQPLLAVRLAALSCQQQLQVYSGSGHRYETRGGSLPHGVSPDDQGLVSYKLQPPLGLHMQLLLRPKDSCCNVAHTA